MQLGCRQPWRCKRACSCGTVWTAASEQDRSSLPWGRSPAEVDSPELRHPAHTEERLRNTGRKITKTKRKTLGRGDEVQSSVPHWQRTCTGLYSWWQTTASSTASCCPLTCSGNHSWRSSLCLQKPGEKEEHTHSPVFITHHKSTTITDPCTCPGKQERHFSVKKIFWPLLVQRESSSVSWWKKKLLIWLEKATWRRSGHLRTRTGTKNSTNYTHTCITCLQNYNNENLSFFDLLSFQAWPNYGRGLDTVHLAF